jgi:hypothetical protein
MLLLSTLSTAPLFTTEGHRQNRGDRLVHRLSPLSSELPCISAFLPSVTYWVRTQMFGAYSVCSLRVPLQARHLQATFDDVCSLSVSSLTGIQ